MNFFFAKLFEEYQRKNDLPNVHITLYISLCYFFILFDFYLPASEMANKLYFDGRLAYNTSLVLVAVFSVLGLLIFAVYTVYIKNRKIFALTEKYKEAYFNKIILYSLTAFFPVSLLLLGATVTVLLKGGTILNHHFNGLI